MHKTKIDWCDFTWNPVWGCRNHCPYCYARATARRWGISFEPTWRERNFNRAMPKEPARIFVNSMSDVMYWEPDWWRRVLARIRENPQHAFLFLTQDPTVYWTWADQIPRNCWLGATATDQYSVLLRGRLLGMLRPEHLTFLSIEPILEAILPETIDPRFVSWVILGAESGNRKGRVMPPADWIHPWVEAKGIPVFMKSGLPWAGPWRKEFPLWQSGY